MALELIGRKCGADVLDIHAGGVDLIFPHHEDEIAQSCAFTGEADFARYWMHGEFLNIARRRRCRSGSATSPPPRDLREDGVDPGAIRLLMFQTHYRQKLDLTDEALAARARRARGGWASSRAGCRTPPGRATNRRSSPRWPSGSSAEVAEALDDDLNAPRAVAALFDFVGEGNRRARCGAAPGPPRRGGLGAGRTGCST